MTYAILQKELVVPDVEQLRRAFTVSPLLTGLDAQTAASDAYGILLRGLEAEHATTLREALLRERVETEIVDESTLPAIALGKTAKQAAFSPTHLTLYDSLNRPSTVSWKEIMFIAAGYVRTGDVRKHRSAVEEARLRSAAASLGDTPGAASPEDQYRLLLEIFLHGGTARYSIAADEFAFDHLGERLSDDPAINFVLLVQDLAEKAPDAGLNRGAFMACQHPPELFPYPSKAAFNEELTWMLWKIANLGRAEAATVAP
jgi:hypothetical protein